MGISPRNMSRPGTQDANSSLKGRGMGQQYKNPPITEVVCEFRFSDDSPWDSAIPGILYEHLKDSFPKREPVHQFEAKVATVPGGVEQQFALVQKSRFASEDGLSFLQVGQHVLSVHALAPYRGWQHLRPTIGLILGRYVAAAQPAAVVRVGLRYLNTIRIPCQQFDLKDYFDFFPAIGERLPQEHGAFIVGAHFPFDSGGDLLRTQLTLAGITDTSSFDIVLDLDYFTASADRASLDTNATLAWLNAAHERTEAVFEGCLTDKTRNLFGGHTNDA